MFAKAIHVCEHTFEGVRRREPAGTTFECDPDEFDILRKLGGAKVVKSDPMDRDGNGDMGGSKKGWKRRGKTAPSPPPVTDPVDPPLTPAPPVTDPVDDLDIDESLRD